MPNNDMLVIDCLQHPNPDRERFEKWRAGGIDCAHITLAIWENPRETLSVIGK